MNDDNDFEKTDLKKHIRQRPKEPISMGNCCKITIEPCCHKMDYALAEGKLFIDTQKTIFNKNNVLIERASKKPVIKTRDGMIQKHCPYCTGKIEVTKDVSNMVTPWSANGIRIPTKEEAIEIEKQYTNQQKQQR